MRSLNGGTMIDKAYFRLNGAMYTWTGWFGCQLESIERRMLPPGTERELIGRSFRVFRVTREGFFRFRTTWSIPLDCEIDEAGRRIRDLKDALRALV